MASVIGTSKHFFAKSFYFQEKRRPETCTVEFVETKLVTVVRAFFFSLLASDINKFWTKTNIESQPLVTTVIINNRTQRVWFRRSKVLYWLFQTVQVDSFRSQKIDLCTRPPSPYNSIKQFRLGLKLHNKNCLEPVVIWV